MVQKLAHSLGRSKKSSSPFSRWRIFLKLLGKIDAIEQLLDEKNNATLKELSQGFQKNIRIKVSISYYAIVKKNNSKKLNFN
ncbi:hypothetical protein [Microcoleus sp. F4-D5]|uniref:hypothetical protein n=1 Tax=Microcoleus sp. F4-D5 TaxID=2818760 RepID=UPI002FD2B893